MLLSGSVHLIWFWRSWIKFGGVFAVSWWQAKMGSLESGVSLKRDPPLRSSSSTGRAERHSFLQRQRSRLSRFFFLRKLDYLQWICTVAVFLFFVVLFQMFLPGSMIEKSGNALRDAEFSSNEFLFLKEFGLLDFGDDIRFEPSKLLAKFQKEARGANFSNAFNRTRQRSGNRSPQLALVYVQLFSYFWPTIFYFRIFLMLHFIPD